MTGDNGMLRCRQHHPAPCQGDRLASHHTTDVLCVDMNGMVWKLVIARDVMVKCVNKLCIHWIKACIIDQ